MSTVSGKQAEQRQSHDKGQRSAIHRKYLLPPPRWPAEQKQGQRETHKKSEQPTPTFEKPTSRGDEHPRPKEQLYQRGGQPQQHRRPRSLEHTTGGGQQRHRIRSRYA